jgi:guanine nucleotide-binding protein G(i) subunit alpha
MMLENPKENRMQDSIRLFGSICNNRLLKDACMILFLNKKDILERKIANSPLTKCFPEYTGVVKKLFFVNKFGRY